MSLVEKSPLSSLTLMVSSVSKEVQLSNNYVDTVRGQTLERIQELLQMIPVNKKFTIYKMIGSSLLGASTLLNF